VLTPKHGEGDKGGKSPSKAEKKKGIRIVIKGSSINSHRAPVSGGGGDSTLQEEKGGRQRGKPEEGKRKGPGVLGTRQKGKAALPTCSQKGEGEEVN